MTQSTCIPSSLHSCAKITKLKIFVPDLYGWTPELDPGSDGVVKQTSSELFRWVASSEEVFTQEQQNKFTLIKTLQLK